MQQVNETIARTVLNVVDAGLVRGLGSAKPGQMCVEAAVCFAYGLPHSDNPPCVGAAVRAFKIRLNDAAWSSDQARAKGMRKLAIAQLGSDQIDQKAFRQIVAEQTIRQIVPIALRAAAKRNPKCAERLEAAAVRCEQEGTQQAAEAARNPARETRNGAAACAAKDVTDAAAAAYAAAAACAAKDVTDAAAYAYAAAHAAAAAYEAASAYAAAAERDRVLAVSADLALAALLALNSPGCEFLYLTEAA